MAVMSQKRAAHLGWHKTYRAPAGLKGDVWKHREGWILEHCGHPTALRPWGLSDANGLRIQTFSRLEQAMTYVAQGVR